MVKLVSEKPQGGVNYILDTWSSIIPSIEDNHLYLSTSDAKSILFNREIFCFLSPFLSSLIKGTFQGSCCLANYFDTTIILPDVSSKAVYDLKSLMIKGTVSGLSGYDAKELMSLYSFLGFESMIMKEENDDELTVVHEYRIEDDKTDGDGGYDDYDEGDEANKDDRSDGMTPSAGPHSPGVPRGTDPHGPTSNSLAPSSSSGVNTPIGPPASQEDREYLDKVKQLEKYIEPLRRKIMEIGNEDQDKLAKMKKLLDILSNPDKRMPLGTLLKCEDILKKLDTVEPEENEDKSTENRTTTPDIIGREEEPTRASNKVMENASVMDEDLNEGSDWWRLRLRKIPGTSNNISSTDPDNEEELHNEGESNKIKTRLRKKKDSIYKKKRDSDDSDFDFDVENVRPAQKRKRSGKSQGPVSYKDMFSSDDF